MPPVTKNVDRADIRDFGVTPGTDETAAIQFAIDQTGDRSAELWFPQGEWVAQNIVVTGKSQLRGYGDVSVLRQPDGANGAHITVHQSALTAGTRAARNRRTVLSGFRCTGDNTTTDNVGLHCLGAGGLRFCDLTFEEYGGEQMWLDGDNADGSQQVLLSEFDRLTFTRPVDAHLTGKPYVRMTGIVNGNDFNRWGFRSLTTEDDGPTVLTMEPGDFTGGTRVPDTNKFHSMWTEFMHTPDGGTVFDLLMVRSLFEMPQWFDHGSQPTPGTSWIRLNRDPAVGFSDIGGNHLYGWVPSNSNAAGSYEVGVDVFQSRNRIEGVKGFRHAAVRLNAGVELTRVDLGGQESDVVDAASPSAGVIDSSGQESNTIWDTCGRAGRIQFPSHAPIQVFDTGGTLRTLQQPTGPGAATWV